MQATKPTPSDHLRRLTVFVDEPDHGQFYWVLIESTDDAAIWADVESSETSFPTWSQAFAAGGHHLLGLIQDTDVGPRTPGEDENASPVG